MKKLFYLSVVTVIAACTVQQPISYAPSHNNADYDVAYLFEHDGCKVYRFMDDGSYVYFTNVRSDVTIVPNDSTVITNTVREQ